MVTLTDAERLHAAFDTHHVRYLFIGTSAATLLGYAVTPDDLDVFVDSSPENTSATLAALGGLGFVLDPLRASQILEGKRIVLMHDGPFPLDVTFRPQGIESFACAWQRHVNVSGMPVCHPDDILASKIAANRTKDRAAVPGLRAFRDAWIGAGIAEDDRRTSSS